jgi:uncharacterized membrane protein
MVGDRPRDTASPQRWIAGTTRIEAFSDGVYAIAITLLVLNLGIPDGLADGQVWGAIADEGAKFLAAGISFAVIGMYWWAHHRIFESFERTSTGLVWLNLAHLATIVFLPFPTVVFAEYNDTFAGVALYALTVAAASFTTAALAWLGWHSNLAGPDRATSSLRGAFIGLMTTGVVFVVSVGVASVNPDVAPYLWPLAAVADRPVNWLVSRRSR